MRHALVALLPLATAGCIHTVTSVVTAPVRVVSKTVDVLTVSPSERDRHYAHKLRKEHEREARERKAWTKRCRGRESTAECAHYQGYVAEDSSSPSTRP